jgi:hypothetical protein
MAVINREQPKGSLQDDAGSAAVDERGAGIEGGAHADMGRDEVQTARNATPKGDIEERRETEQVIRPSTDGVGEGLTKDAG